MSAIKQRDFSHIPEFEEPPTKRLVSDGDIFIKQLSERQRKTVVNLQEQLANTKEFTSGSELIPMSSYDPGIKSLQGFKQSIERFSCIEKFKAAGLTNEDIQMLMDSTLGEDYLFQKHKNWEHTLLRDRINSIKDVVKRFETNEDIYLDDDANKQQKHDLVEYGLSAKPDSVETKLLRFALQNQKQKQKLELPHPIHTIKQIEQNRFSYLNQTFPSVSRIRRKARKLMNRIENVSRDLPITFPNAINNKGTPNCSLAKESKWDVEQAVASKTDNSDKKVYTCLPQNYYTIRDGTIIKLNKKEIQERKLEVASRLSVEEIRNLPKFQNYDFGSPSKVLYLRNLSRGVKENDIIELFRNYSDLNITYKLMKGKMRGQAFVTFPDETVAKKALDDTNGIIIRNKPVIIQFGHKVKMET